MCTITNDKIDAPLLYHLHNIISTAEYFPSTTLTLKYNIVMKKTMQAVVAVYDINIDYMRIKTDFFCDFRYPALDNTCILYFYIICVQTLTLRLYVLLRCLLMFYYCGYWYFLFS